MWTEVSRLLDQAVADDVVPGAAIVVRGPQQTWFDYHVGVAERAPRVRPLHRDHPFDLASLTKVLCTTPVTLSLVNDGLLDLHAPLSELLDDAPMGVTAVHCLQHSSGLPAWVPLFERVIGDDLPWGTLATRGAVSARARTMPVESPPGIRHRYSDLGMLLLGAALEVAGGDRLDRLFERRVRGPSGVDLRWGWPDAVATERCPVRQRVVVGEVHDLNAAVMGGVAAHAGLFGSARAAAAAAAWQLRAFHGETAGLDPSLVRAAWTIGGPGSHRMGWDGVSPGGCTAGPDWPLDGVGHLGFTGCSLWVAPRQGLVVALATNRVHPTIEGGAVPGGDTGPRTQAFRALRPAVHSAVIAALRDEGRWAGT